MPKAAKRVGPKTTAPRARRTAARTLSLNARLGARTEYRIYPSIGIARVGDCLDSCNRPPQRPQPAHRHPHRSRRTRLISGARGVSNYTQTKMRR